MYGCSESGEGCNGIGLSGLFRRGRGSMRYTFCGQDSISVVGHLRAFAQVSTLHSERDATSCVVTQPHLPRDIRTTYIGFDFDANPNGCKWAVRPDCHAKAVTFLRTGATNVLLKWRKALHRVPLYFQLGIDSGDEKNGCLNCHVFISATVTWRMNRLSTRQTFLDRNLPRARRPPERRSRGLRTTHRVSKNPDDVPEEARRQYPSACPAFPPTKSVTK